MDGNSTSFIAQKKNLHFLEEQKFLVNHIIAKKEVYQPEIPSHIR